MKLYQIILLIAAAALIISAVIIETSKKKTGMKEVSVKKGSFIRWFYNALKTLPFLSGFVLTVENRLRPIYPTSGGRDGEYLKPVVKILCADAVTALLSFVLIWLINPSAYTLVTAIYVTWAVCTVITGNTVRQEEIKFLKETDIYLANVSHCFYQNPSPREALYLAIRGTGKRMKACAEEICDVLNAEDRDGIRKLYILKPHHKYMRLLMSFADAVEENGDTVNSRGSVFISSVIQVRGDVQNDRRHIEDKQHRFRALGLTAVIPVIAIPYISAWGVDTLPQLANFYIGETGSLVRAGLLIASVICFSLINMVENEVSGIGKKYKLLSELASSAPVKPFVNLIMKRDEKKAARRAEILKRIGETYSVRVLYLKKIIYLVAAVILTSVIVMAGHADRRSQLLNDVSTIDTLSDTADGSQITAMEELIPVYVSAYVSGKEMPEREELISTLLAEKGIRSEMVASDAADEIIRRVEEYKNERFSFIDILIIAFVSFLACGYPTQMLDLRANIIENRMQEEVIQFQSLINMLAMVPGSTPVTILEAMEEFSVVFKPAIRRCINEYNIDDQEALMHMRDSETYYGFKKIVDDFLMVDEVGMEKAFEEISDEITNFKEDRRLDRAMLLDNEVLLATLLAVIPGGLILFGYLLIPFLYKALTMFNEYTAELSSLIG